ncbi:hypothetical protein FHU33_2378 [Blastococcus colisei]|uniref:Uncharacterized protein n=1 Tax=Blastococcus colisei TaxID=1564162 RepID=A0A543PFV2_9ACTN|nr:hypothetical protein [Blastococcus colisei]TQN42959.1 hypothetical protein FHU33_2378 [Blastococcus colisei]
MTAAWLTIALLLVGAPLLAWWLGGRTFWARLRPGRDPDPWGDVVRRHRLSAGEAARLGREVARGVRFDDERQRAAAVDLAGLLLGQGLFPDGASRTQRVLVVVLVLWLTAVLARVVFLLVSGRPQDVNWVTVLIWAGAILWHRTRRRGLRRTIALNS